MKKIRIKHTDLEVSNLVMGCMRIGELSEKELEELTETYLSEGVNFFDHADIYGGGACETAFGKLLKKKPELRGQIYLQSKCGIRQGVL